MHVIDLEVSNADKRFIAMARQTPLHAFMFNSQGKLLVANDAAMEACLHSTAGLKIPNGQDITLKSLFDLGAYNGEPSNSHTLLAFGCSETTDQEQCVSCQVNHSSAFPGSNILADVMQTSRLRSDKQLATSMKLP